MHNKTELTLYIMPEDTHLCIKDTFDIVTLRSEKARALIDEFNRWSDVSCKNSSFLKTYFKDGNIEWCDFHKRARTLHLELRGLLDDKYNLTMIKLVDKD